MNKPAVMRAALILTVFTILSGLGAADYQINYTGGFNVPTNISDDAQHNQLVEVNNSDSSEPVTPPVLSDADYEVNSIYNSSTGNRVNMTHLAGGHYFSNYTINRTEGRYSTFEIRDDANVVLDDSEVVYDIGNISVEIMNSRDELHDNMKFGERFTAEINASVMGYDQFEDQADVDLWFTNGSWTSDIYQINNPGKGYFFNSKIDVPDNSDSSYIMYVNASVDSAAYEQAYGSTSVIVNTLPQIEGNFTDITAGEGCNNNSFFKQCERGTNITADLNITQSAAENVNMSLEAMNSTGGWENFSTKQASTEEGIYTANFDVPDLDTSEYQKKMRIKYNATSPKRTDIGYYNFDYRTFRTFYRSASQTPAGEYDLNVEFRKYFTPTTLNRSRISADVDVYQPNGDSFASYTLDQMTFDEVEGWFTDTLELPYGESEGIWTVEVNASNPYDDFEATEFTFQLMDVKQTFTSETELSRDVERRGVQEFDLEVENLLTEQEIDIEPEVGDEISGFTDVNNGNNLTLSAAEVSNFTVELNITDVDGYESEIELQDTESSYNRTVDVSIEAPSCVHKVGPVCIQDYIPEVSMEEIGHETEQVSALFIGETDEEVNLTSSVEGNISEYVEVTPERVKLNHTDDSAEVELNYSATSPGYFTGNLTMEADGEEYKPDIQLNSTVEPRDASFEISGDTEFGDVESGEDVELELTIENTGNADIDSLEYSSSTYDEEADSTSVATGEEVDRIVTLNNVDSSSGQISITASSTAGEVTEMISISGNVVPNYINQVSDLEARVPQIDRKIPQGHELQTELSNVQSTIADVKTAYRNDNYERAESLYNDASNQIDTISQRANQLDQQNGQDNQGGSDSENNSGGSIILVILLVVVLLLIGFVVYSSYIPEEGDPLYDVLG